MFNYNIGNYELTSGGIWMPREDLSKPAPRKTFTFIPETSDINIKPVDCIKEGNKYYFVDAQGKKYPAMKGHYTEFKLNNSLPARVPDSSLPHLYPNEEPTLPEQKPNSTPESNPTPNPDHKPAQRRKIKSPALVEFEKQWSKEAIQKKVAAYRKAMEKQGLKGEQLEEQVARYKEGLQAERAKALNKLKGKAKARGIASGKIKVKPQVTPKPEGNGIIGKIGKFFKGKGGRAALIGAGILAAGALVACLLKGCSKDGADEAATDPKTPAAEDGPKETAPETPGVVDGPKETDPAKDDREAKTGTFKAIPGSFEWRFAERELLLEHLGEANYKPSATEISQRAAEIAARDNRKIDNTGHSVDENGKWVQVGEDMILTEQMAQLANEARAQLIQEHKDQKDYEPSWAEIRKIVDKKIQDLQAEALKPAA